MQSNAFSKKSAVLPETIQTKFSEMRMVFDQAHSFFEDFDDRLGRVQSLVENFLDDDFEVYEENRKLKTLEESQLTNNQHASSTATLDNRLSGNLAIDLNTTDSLNNSGIQHKSTKKLLKSLPQSPKEKKASNFKNDIKCIEPQFDGCDGDTSDVFSELRLQNKQLLDTINSGRHNSAQLVELVSKYVAEIVTKADHEKSVLKSKYKSKISDLKLKLEVQEEECIKLRSVKDFYQANAINGIKPTSTFESEKCSNSYKRPVECLNCKLLEEQSQNLMLQTNALQNEMNMELLEAYNKIHALQRQVASLQTQNLVNSSINDDAPKFENLQKTLPLLQNESDNIQSTKQKYDDLFHNRSVDCLENQKRQTRQSKSVNRSSRGSAMSLKESFEQAAKVFRPRTVERQTRGELVRLHSEETESGYINMQMFRQATIPQGKSSNFQMGIFDQNVYEEFQQQSNSSDDNSQDIGLRQLQVKGIVTEISRPIKSKDTRLTTEPFLNNPKSDYTDNLDEFPLTISYDSPLKTKGDYQQKMSLKQLLACDKPLTLTSKLNVFKEEQVEVNEIDYTTEENRQIKKVHKSLGKFLGLDLGTNTGMLENFLSFAGNDDKLN